MKDSCVIFLCASVEEEAVIGVLREKVFFSEQGIPIEAIWDEDDEYAFHFFAKTLTGEVVGAVRLTRSGQVGRLAVKKSCRGQGIARLLIEYLMLFAKVNSFQPLYLNAQVQTISFYEKFGFVFVGDVFVEVGIEHILMEYSYAE